MFGKSAPTAAAPAAAPAPRSEPEAQKSRIVTHDQVDGLDRRSTSLLHWFSGYDRPFDVNEMYKRGFADIDLGVLVRKGYLAPLNNADGATQRAIMQVTGRYPDYPVYTVTDKGSEAIGGRRMRADKSSVTLTPTNSAKPTSAAPRGISPGSLARSMANEAYQNDANSSVDGDDEQQSIGFAQPQGQPQSGQQAPATPTGAQPPKGPQPNAAQPPAPPSAPAKPNQPPQQGAAPQPNAQQSAPQQNAQQAPQPNAQQPAPVQPNQNDMNSAKQIADKIKASPNYNPANVDSDIQKSIVAMGKSGSNSQDMTNLVKQQMGMSESARPARRKK